MKRFSEDLSSKKTGIGFGADGQRYRTTAGVLHRELTTHIFNLPAGKKHFYQFEANSAGSQHAIVNVQGHGFALLSQLSEIPYTGINRFQTPQNVEESKRKIPPDLNVFIGRK